MLVGVDSEPFETRANERRSSFSYGYHISSLNNLEFAMTCRAGEEPGWLLSPCVRMTASSLTMPFQEAHLKRQEAQFGFVSAAFAIGGLVGSLMAGSIADNRGRKQAVIASSTWLAAGSSLLAAGGKHGVVVGVPAPDQCRSPFPPHCWTPRSGRWMRHGYCDRSHLPE